MTDTRSIPPGMIANDFQTLFGERMSVVYDGRVLLIVAEDEGPPTLERAFDHDELGVTVYDFDSETAQQLAVALLHMSREAEDLHANH